ncbi:MAG: F0F1 ATP synthase subunit epsilon [Chloroflexi bacterium]|nr:F0F1 ATP synthase subunit epsilon [Chloroflexota bacterium]
MAKLTVQVVTAERSMLEESDVDMVVAPASEGEVGILPRHAALLATLNPGELRIKRGGEETHMAVSGGFLQVANDRVLVLADTAERAEEIDEARAEQARQRALELLHTATVTPSQVAAARMALHRSLARLDVQRKRRRRSAS